MVIEVCHFPPGTSKWNKIEHQLFCHITRTWKARPLMTVDGAVAGIAATITSKGLKCHPVRDGGDYPEGVKVPDARMRHLEDRVIERGAFHGEWNYALLPVPRPAAPAPEPEPARERVPAAALNHPALTGMTTEDVNALAAALELPFAAWRDKHNRAVRARRRGARRPSRPAAPPARTPGSPSPAMSWQPCSAATSPCPGSRSPSSSAPSGAPSATPPPSSASSSRTTPSRSRPPPRRPPGPAPPPASSPTPPQPASPSNSPITGQPCRNGSKHGKPKPSTTRSKQPTNFATRP